MRAGLGGALAWFALAAAIGAGILWLDRESRRLPIDPVVSQGGGSVTLRRDRDGHYRVPGMVGGEPVLFLVDTGATRTIVPRAIAQRAHLAPVGVDVARTAAGPLKLGVARADLALAGGLRFEGLTVDVSPVAGVEPLLGMDVLGRLRFSQDGETLRLELAVPRRQ